MNIGDMGFKEGRIVEAIVTTYNPDESPNAAPIGVHTESEGEILMNLHTESDTFQNLLRNGGCVINVIFDPCLFVRACVKGSGKGARENEVTDEETLPAKRVKAPALKNASACIEAKLQGHSEHTKSDYHKKTEFSSVVCGVREVTINKKYPTAVNRGLFAAIEAAIAISRGMGPDKRCIEIMRKTLTEEEYKKIMELL